MGRSLHDGGDGGGGYPWAKGLWYGVYPGDAPNGFANRPWRLALSIWALGNAIDEAAVAAGYPNWCLGTRGDTRHLEEAEKSEHNACVVSKLRSKLPADIPDEFRNAFLVLAIDVIEEVVDLLDLDAAFAKAYRLRDPKVYPKGYNHHNNMITLWGGSGEMRPLPGDVGHGHYSGNQNAYPGGREGYLDALDSLVSWYGDGSDDEENELNSTQNAALTEILDGVRDLTSKQTEMQDRQNTMEQASKAMRGDVVPVVEDLGKKVDALSAKLDAVLNPKK